MFIDRCSQRRRGSGVDALRADAALGGVDVAALVGVGVAPFFVEDAFEVGGAGDGLAVAATADVALFVARASALSGVFADGSAGP